MDFFWVNDVYDKVCRRSLERIRQRALQQSKDVVKMYHEALGSHSVPVVDWFVYWWRHPTFYAPPLVYDWSLFDVSC